MIHQPATNPFPFRSKSIYNWPMESESLIGEFHPELLSRRGESLAWLTAVLSFLAWTLLTLTGRPVLTVVPFMSFFFLFAAASISLGNWMDRRTVLRLEQDGVAFKNGLRNVQLSWDQIAEIQVFAANWGKKVRVIGDRAHFDFRTLGEVKLGGEVKGRLGFVQGEPILRQILLATGLKEVEHNRNSYYYARQ
jgi:hypothetical protein